MSGSYLPSSYESPGRAPGLLELIIQTDSSGKINHLEIGEKRFIKDAAGKVIQTEPYTQEIMYDDTLFDIDPAAEATKLLSSYGSLVDSLKNTLAEYKNYTAKRDIGSKLDKIVGRLPRFMVRMAISIHDEWASDSYSDLIRSTLDEQTHASTAMAALAGYLKKGETFIKEKLKVSDEKTAGSLASCLELSSQAIAKASEIKQYADSSIEFYKSQEKYI